MIKGKVPRHLIVSVLAVSTEDALHYLDTKTGEIVSIDDPFEVDDPNELLELAVSEERYVALPSLEEVEAEHFEVQFAEQQEGAQREELLRAARSLYAKMLFSDAISNVGLRDDWESFRDRSLEALAAKWAESNGIELV